MKICHRCKASKNLRDFVPQSRTCKLCESERTRTYTYGITVKDIDTLWYAQDGLCAICGIEFEDDGNRNTTYHVDHCHDTNKVRGLLCRNCNVGLGFFKDNPTLLKKALAYLETNK